MGNHYPMSNIIELIFFVAQQHLEFYQRSDFAFYYHYIKQYLYLDRGYTWSLSGHPIFGVGNYRAMVDIPCYHGILSCFGNLPEYNKPKNKHMTEQDNLRFCPVFPMQIYKTFCYFHPKYYYDSVDEIILEACRVFISAK